MQVQGAGGLSVKIGANQPQNALNKTNKALQKILEQLSAAKRINQASDDAAGLGIAENLTAATRGFKVASQNIASATAMLDVADGAARETTDLLQRQRELAVAAKNDTLTAADREFLDKEYQALTKEIGRLAEVTNYNNRNVTNGTDLASGNAKIQVGPNAGDSVNLPPVDLKQAAESMRNTSLASAEDAGSALARVDTILDTVNTQRSAMGSMMNKLTSAGDNLAVSMVNTQAAESVIRDQDMAIGIAELIKQRILQEGAYKTFSRFNEINRDHILGILGQ
jgi:flagellin